ncbi:MULTISPECIES: DUF6778 family protein [Pacificibacter]|uniref:DUF6778 family protein n=1 Tax=Pacificibacter TaxID=1042323 RepID=UPI001C08737C|nr:MULTISPECIES: DUF6778 family protein [Pacificibacter]MBU2936252.1 hypothetical protein [Pacificibacter marinus]MDO6616721.1 hypothetical protein [Pacificibacter sp. 1_MG-2023]
MKTVTKRVKMIAAIGLMVSAAACAPVETVSRAAPIDAPLSGQVSAKPNYIQPDFKVSKINVFVPKDLTVSEANTYKPNADIVWRGDAYGNRYEQVQAVLEAGLATGARAFDGAKEVIVDVQLVQFHAQTEKVRYTFGGEHEIMFAMTIRDAQTGATLVPPRLVDATFDALGGIAAVNAEKAGVTQKVRIIERLAEVITTELQQPYAF